MIKILKPILALALPLLFAAGCKSSSDNAATSATDNTTMEGTRSMSTSTDTTGMSISTRTP